jgi:hypothetical protein
LFIRILGLEINGLNDYSIQFIYIVIW